MATAANVSGVDGISSSILEYDPYYSAYNVAGTNSSVILTKPDISQWAQLGWVLSQIDGGVVRREVFLEFYLSPTQNYFQFWPAMPLGTSTWYEITNNSYSVFNFFVGGTFYAQYTGGWVPGTYNVFGETHDWVDQMPGGTSAHVTFVNTQYFISGISYFVTSPISSGDPAYGGSNPSTGRYEIWDTACST